VSRLPARDLADITERNAALFRELAGAHVLITGAAGFAGSWMLESLLFAADELGVDVHATAVVRNANDFRARHPHLVSHGRVETIAADVRRLRLDTPPTHVIHAASATSPERHLVDPGDIIDTIERGTRRILELAAESGARRTLVLSSGSVYQRGARDVHQMDEEHATVVEGASLAERLGAAKRRAERSVEESGVHASIARIFTVVGPRLPSAQFAISQFLDDALANRPVRVTGDGTPVRTYLYAADLVNWCWTILVRGDARRVYNVGASQEHEIADVADRVARLRAPKLDVRTESSPTTTIDRYVPDTSRARDELGLEAWTGFDDALHRTWTWLKGARA
jgi:nucleoside-diphosphate-sugar epimerase